MKKPIVLAILDGFGIGKHYAGNAINKANKPNIDKLFATYQHTTLGACSRWVGLPDGQMGNSEVGHLNIGSGRIVYQGLTLVSKNIENGTLFKNEDLLKAFNQAEQMGSTVHICGLLSDGGVHSHIAHIKALLEFGKNNFPKANVVLHAFLDGRDTDRASAKEFVKQVAEFKIASLSGRYYAMDRDKNFDRLNKFIDVLNNSTENVFDDSIEYIDSEYNKEHFDEFVLPAKAKWFNGVNDNDTFIFANFRPDRMIELAETLTNEEYVNYKKIAKNNFFVSMTKYSDGSKAKILLENPKVENTLGMVLSQRGYKQLRIAETEKYAHVTFFFDGGKNIELPGADRVLINSPKVATYDLQPEMSAPLITAKLLEELDKDLYDVVILNFANCDMVGHTGKLDAAIKAVETIDNCVGKLYEKVKSLDGKLIICADHGNADEMIGEHGEELTSHSLNRVPFLITDQNIKLVDDIENKLSDIAPTILNLMGEIKPDEMTGKSLIA